LGFLRVRGGRLISFSTRQPYVITWGKSVYVELFFRHDNTLTT